MLLQVKVVSFLLSPPIRRGGVGKGSDIVKVSHPETEGATLHF